MPVAALAEDWQHLTGPEITAALTARVLHFADGTMQDFHAGGRTLAGMREGRWRVTGDLYCSAWPPAETWDCYAVEHGAGGLDIRFTAGDGTVSVGRYNDLN